MRLWSGQITSDLMQIDECLRQGLTPFVTIFHWDYPLALEDRYGGFYDCDKIVPDFARFASLCFERFGDRVKHWITINEVSLADSIDTDTA